MDSLTSRTTVPNGSVKGAATVSEPIEVIQDLRIFAVEVEGPEVRVDVYGGIESICGTLVYTFDDRGQRDERLAVLRRWCEEATSLTYVLRDGTAALMDEVALFAEAFGG